jgi:hypothetical protein
MPSIVRILLVGLVVALAVLGCAGPTPTPSPTPSPSAGLTASPGPTPAATATASLEDQIAAVEAGVPALRGLEPTADVPKRILDETGLRAELTRILDASMTADQFAAASRFGARLGLLPPGTDLRALQLELLGSQVLGFYDQDTGAMTLIQRGTAFGVLEKVTLAHEYTHALQDQHFQLEGLGLDDISEGDRALARLALVEGDATWVMTQWAGAHLSFAEALSLTLEGLDPAQTAMLETMPPIVRRQLTFPYSDGLAFVGGLQAEGGWPAVDAAYARPPDSTEQILHPEKYAAGEPPITVVAPDELEALGGGWSMVLTDTLGELSIEVWLEPSAGSAASAEAAAGWGGDRVAMYEGPNGAWLIAWSTAWDSAADAQQFSAAASAALGSAHGRVLGSSGSSKVAVYLASGLALLDRVAPSP